MRFLSLRIVTTAITIAAATLATGSARPARAAVPIHIEIPRIELPRSGKPLTPSEWIRGNPIYERRLRAVGGTEEALVVEESLRALTQRRLREACRECADEAADDLLSGELQSLVETGQALSLQDATEKAIDSCLASRLPEYTPDEAREEFSAYLAQQLPLDDSGQSSESANVSVDYAGTETGGSSTTGDAGGSAGDVGSDDGSSFPWGAAAVIAACCAVALLFAASRRRS